MSTRITIDPITRIEGHLRIDAEIADGKVTKAWSSGQMWRGVELILLGRDPRDAWTITQRICGVCTTVHAIASVRAVENALQLEVPLNAQFIRNMIQSAHAIHDHIVHFYHLSALDFVDVVSALKADPVKAANWIQQYSDWHLNGKEVMIATQERLKAFVGTGQLGPFTNGYWGHPAMKLTPEINLVAVAHYLQALEIQREANKIVTILGSKTPHIQNLAVGGVSNPIAVDSQSVLTVDRLYAIKTQIDKLADFVNKVYLIDVAAIGSVYADWTKYGAGVMNYLSAPDFPTDTKGTQFMYPGGYIPGGDLSKYQPIKSFGDDFLGKGVEELVKHSWYTYSKEGPLHPYKGETTPHYTDFQDDGKYSWLKSPTFYGKRAQVGPLAAVLNAVAGRPSADHRDRYQGARHGVGAGWQQGRGGRAAFDHRPPRRPRGALLHHGGPARSQLAEAHRQYRQGRRGDLQQAHLPQRRDRGLRLPRGAARTAFALGRYPRWQDRELSMRGAVHLERRPALGRRHARAV